MALDTRLVLPDYGGACVCNVATALLDDPDHLPSWFPSAAVGADQVVMLVVDGLGWNQLQERLSIATTMAAMEGVAITTVAPTTTATGLTSLATSAPPGEHGVVGYRIAVGRDILNVLRWSTSRGDARDSIDPRRIGLVEPFGSQRPPVVNRAEVEFSGFTEAHLRGTRHAGYRMPSTLNAEVVRLLRSGEPFIYAYYDGVDKVAHEYGLADHYAAELQAIDMMIAALIAALPRNAALVITADHGQVDVGANMVKPHPEVLGHTDFQSGEGRFRWLHARPGAARDLLDAAGRHHGDVAWVLSREQIISDGWLGPKVVPEAVERLGDVALVARDPVAFEDPADTGPFQLVSRHGSLTSAEMFVPLLAYCR